MPLDGRRPELPSPSQHGGLRGLRRNEENGRERVTRVEGPMLRQQISEPRHKPITIPQLRNDRQILAARKHSRNEVQSAVEPHSQGVRDRLAQAREEKQRPGCRRLAIETLCRKTPRHAALGGLSADGYADQRLDGCWYWMLAGGAQIESPQRAKPKRMSEHSQGEGPETTGWVGRGRTAPT